MSELCITFSAWVNLLSLNNSHRWDSRDFPEYWITGPYKSIEGWTGLQALAITVYPVFDSDTTELRRQVIDFVKEFFASGSQRECLSWGLMEQFPLSWSSGKLEIISLLTGETSKAFQQPSCCPLDSFWVALEVWTRRFVTPVNDLLTKTWCGSRISDPQLGMVALLSSSERASWNSRSVGVYSPLRIDGWRKDWVKISNEVVPGVPLSALG